MAEKEHFEGKFNEGKGKVRETFGEMTGDEEQQAKGQVEQGKGKVQGMVGDVKEAARDLGNMAKGAVDALRDKPERR